MKWPTFNEIKKADHKVLVHWWLILIPKSPTEQKKAKRIDELVWAGWKGGYIKWIGLRT